MVYHKNFFFEILCLSKNSYPNEDKFEVSELKGLSQFFLQFATTPRFLVRPPELRFAKENRRAIFRTRTGIIGATLILHPLYIFMSFFRFLAYFAANSQTAKQLKFTK